MDEIVKFFNGISSMGWLGFAILSALFAALTNIFGKIGVPSCAITLASR